MPDGGIQWPPFGGPDLDQHLSKLEEIADGVVAFLRADKERYTTSMELVRGSSGLFKPPLLSFSAAAIQLKSRLQVVISQGLTRMVFQVAEHKLIGLDNDQLVKALKKATDEKPARMHEFLIRRCEEGETVTLAGLTSVIYDPSDPNFGDYRKRVKKEIVDPMVALGLWGFQSPREPGASCVIGIGIVLDVFLDRVFEPLAREALYETVRTHPAA